MIRVSMRQRVWRRLDDEVLKPIRAVRRRLKRPMIGIADEAREGLRHDVKAAELRAERVLMETLEHLAKTLVAECPPWTPDSGGPNLGAPAPEDALSSLAAALR